MAGRKLAIAGLAAVVGLCAAGCDRGRSRGVEMPPERPSSYVRHIAYNTGTRNFDYYTGTGEGNFLVIEKDGIKRTYWDRDPAVEGLEFFISEGDEEAYLPNPGRGFTRHYNRAVGMMYEHVRKGSYRVTH